MNEYKAFVGEYMDKENTNEKELLEVDMTLDDENTELQKEIMAKQEDSEEVTEKDESEPKKTEETQNDKKEKDKEKDEIEELRESIKALFNDPEALIDQYVELYKELKETKQKRDEYLDLAQRTQANLENYRKQVIKDQKWANYHNKASIMKQFLSIYDDLSRTLTELQKNPDVTHAKEAIRMIFDNLHSTFENLDVTPIQPQVGEKFDPSIHEAIHAIALADKEDNTIIESVSLGFKLEELVLRPAKVVVVKNKENEKKDKNKDSENKNEKNNKN